MMERKLEGKIICGPKIRRSLMVRTRDQEGRRQREQERVTFARDSKDQRHKRANEINVGAARATRKEPQA